MNSILFLYKNIWGEASVQWPIPLDTLEYGHMSKTRYISASQRV